LSLTLSRARRSVRAVMKIPRQGVSGTPLLEHHIV
jgi:hypothetical protein